MNQQVVSGPKGNLLLGSMLDFRRRPLEFLLDAAETYGDVVRFRLGPYRVYLVNGPDNIHEVLVAQQKKILKTDFNRSLLGRFLGNGILTSEGDFHRRQRRLMQPAFHHQRIASYAEGMVSTTLHMLDGWQAGQRYDIDAEMMKLTLNIVSDALFGSEVSATAIGNVSDAIAILQRITVMEFKTGFSLPEWLPAPRNRRRRKAAQAINDAVLGLIRERRASGKLGDDLLSMLLQAQDEDDGSAMTDEQVLHEATTLFVAGHETTSNALTWTWYLLSQNPEVEARLYDELARVLDGRPPTLDDLPELKYTERVIKEAMRLYPPAWLLFSRSPLEPVNIGGHRINPGEWIFISPYTMHRSAAYFDDPQRFDPERFTEAREKALPRYAYFPFGGGPRVCIGNAFAMMEACLVLATVAQRYRLELDAGQEIVPEPEITMRTRDGLHMTARTRNPAH